MAARAWRATRACAGRSRRSASPTRFASSRSGRRRSPRTCALHPFGLIPTYEEGELVLFETGAIVFHIAEQHPGLFRSDADARARAIAWMFAALNTVEPPILELVTAKFVEGDRPWAEERLPLVKDRIRERLAQLSAAWAMPMARWSVQRGRPDDGVGVARLGPRASSTSIRAWLPTSPAARRGRPTSGRSPRSWRSTPGLRSQATRLKIILPLADCSTLVTSTSTVSPTR